MKKGDLIKTNTFTQGCSVQLEHLSLEELIDIMINKKHQC